MSLVDNLMQQQNGWDYTPSSGGGRFLNLKSKGDEVRIRVIGSAVHAPKWWDGSKFQNWTEDSGVEKSKKTEKFLFLVLERLEDGSSAVRLWETGTQIYTDIKALVQDPEWGPTENYDIRVTRTEESPSKYYKVTPLPSTLNKPLTEEERTAIDESGLADDRKRLEILVGEKDTSASDGATELESPDEDQIDLETGGSEEGVPF